MANGKEKGQASACLLSFPTSLDFDFDGAKELEMLLLQPGGKLLLSPSANCPQGQSRVGVEWLPHSTHFHTYTHSQREASTHMHSVGFTWQKSRWCPHCVQIFDRLIAANERQIEIPA